MKLIEEMGTTEVNAVYALQQANNDIVDAFKILGLATHKDIIYYIELAILKAMIIDYT